MEPIPPSNTELRNIIDKLAQFVARNGPDFEEITKSKQKNNPKFAFLFGGEFYDYYSWKVATHQQRRWNPTPVSMSSIRGSSMGDRPTEERICSIENQQKVLRDQIRESESNLRAQEEVMEKQIDSATRDAIKAAKYERLELLASDTGLNLEEMSLVFQPIVDSCTKDSISSGKSWIFANANSHDNNQLIAHYLSHRVTQDDAPFATRLHLTYLMNDVLHHCVRKGADELKHSLESVAVEMFCAAALSANEEQSLKLNKLITLWENKSIFSGSTLAKMRSPKESWKAYKEQLKEDYGNDIRSTTQSYTTTLENYKAQHLNFVTHAEANILSLENQKKSINEQISAEEARQQLPPPQPPQQHHHPASWSQQQPPPLAEDRSQGGNNRWETNETSMWGQGTGAPSHPPGNPTMYQPPQFPVLPDLSRPPPGFNPTFPPPGIPIPAHHHPHHQLPPPPQQPPQPPPPPLMSVTPVIDENSLIPTIPYYDLPAGLMVPLVNMEDSGYAKPVDPAKIRLPPPTPPTERLMSALEAFYSQPSLDRPRDPDGFEILGLFEFMRDKKSAIDQKKADVEGGRRPKSPSLSPERSVTPNPPERKQTPPPSQCRQETFEGSRKKKRIYRSRTRSRSGSRESTPERNPRRGNRRSASPASYSMPSYLTKRSPSPQANSRRQRRRSGRSQSPDTAFVGFSSPRSSSSSSKNVQIDSSNKGHQMMQRMGWKSGTGLGTDESGIVEPISGGEVRDKKDQYKGVGVSGSDPFEAFRKNKAGSFYTRMKERAESRK